MVACTETWLIGKSPVAMTDAIESGKVAGGGVFIHYGEISDKIGSDVDECRGWKRYVFISQGLCAC